jgi:transcriptional regulator of arginine metabolism
MPQTETRRRVIADLLRRQPVRSQDQLRTLLVGEGFDVTQATLSRDLKALGVLKGPSGYALAERTQPQALGAERLKDAIRQFALGATPAANLIVVRTAPGHAQHVALAVDTTPPDGVVGTVAGDDTIFIAAASAKVATTIAERFRQWAGISGVA